MHRHDATTCGGHLVVLAARNSCARGARQGEFARDRLHNGSASPWRPNVAGRAWCEGGQAGCSHEEISARASACY
jgi:hypothetical protein